MVEKVSRKAEALAIYLEDNYNVPFGIFTWQQWLQMQAQTMQRFIRFQRAIERKEAHEATMVALEMQEMTLFWLKEACAWVSEMEPTE